jgi:hypothetical protein
MGKYRAGIAITFPVEAEGEAEARAKVREMRDEVKNMLRLLGVPHKNLSVSFNATAVSDLRPTKQAALRTEHQSEEGEGK